MKAIILAAGMGSRLRGYTKNTPKCMLKFNNKSLIEQQVETLRSCGINENIIVRGYMPEKIQVPGAKYYFNKDYTNTNMVETMMKAEPEMKGEVLICYSDILYEKRIIQKILESPADIGVTADKNYLDYWRARVSKLEEDIESLVIDKDGKIIELGDTTCGLEKAKFRYIGLIKFSKKGIEALKKVYHENKEKYFEKKEPWLRSKSFKKAYMTSILQALINAGYEVRPIIIDKGWLEFDTSEDYEKYNQWLQEGTLNRFFRFD